MKKTIPIYVCTDPDCPSYYGSDSMPVLREQFTGPKVEDKPNLKASTGSPYRKSRAQCPTNPSHGDRALVMATVDVPEAAPEPLPLPAA